MAKLPKYKITIDPAYSEGEDLGISAIAFTSKPAILTKGFAFSESPSKKQLFADDLKYRTTAPIMKAMDIYRCDEDEEYYVQFTKEEIDLIHQKFMRNFSNKDLFNNEHRSEEIVPAFLLNIWTENDGEEVWVTTQFTDKEAYHDFVEQGKTGYSIEGYLGMKLSEIIEKNKQLEMNKEVKLEDATTTTPIKTIVLNGITYVAFEEKKDEEVTIEADEKTELAEAPEDEAPAVEKADEAKEELADEEVPSEDAPADEKPEAEAPVESYSKEEVDAKFEELYQLIGELKADLSDDKEEPKEETLAAEHKMSAIDRMSFAIQALTELND